eukprot:TRINITY_DN15442_c0_g1_i1.p1 TRINITY_DN15442_c0_g1~~TRINITY_DN15442_c0_g1_i1.p1  ORF type:complete len:538 (+),score=101.50 TRINITY_DN15442_c0_g1_i1:209-1822(+)
MYWDEQGGIGLPVSASAAAATTFAATGSAALQQTYAAFEQVRRHVNFDSALEVSLRSMQPSHDEMEMQKRCIELLEAAVKRLKGGWEMKAFGSIANGFSTKGADLDITCFKQDVPEQQSLLAAQELKFELAPLLRQLPHFEVMKEVWSARVPIIRLKFMGLIDVDFSCHNPQALQNTHLLHAYSSLDSKVRELVLSVKTWAKHEGVCGAPLGHLSSYSLTLMAIYFLQVVHAMPCLPTRCFSYTGYTSEIDTVVWSSPAHLSFLVNGFFSFFSHSFAWGSEVVSVSAGKRMAATDELFQDLPGRMVARLHIEDPFLPRNLNCVLNPENEQILRMKIQQASETIHMGQVPEAFLLACSDSEMPTMQTPWQTDQLWDQGQGVLQPQHHGHYQYHIGTATKLADERASHGYYSGQSGPMPYVSHPNHVLQPPSQTRLLSLQQGEAVSSQPGMIPQGLQWSNSNLQPKTKTSKRQSTDTNAHANANLSYRSSDARIHSDGESTRSGSLTEVNLNEGNYLVTSDSKKFSSVLAWLEAGLQDT